MATGLLNERLEWPMGRRRPAGAWRLGHGLAAVGPGWWPLVRRGFAAVAEAPGARVVAVKQAFGLLVFQALPAADAGSTAGPEAAGLQAAAGTWSRRLAPLLALEAELRIASRTRCEACGRAVPARSPGEDAWRTYCAACDARWAALFMEDPRRAEVRLWEEHAAGVRWPPGVP